MDNLYNRSVKQKFHHVFTEFSKISDYSLGPKLKLKYGRMDFVNYLKIEKSEIRGVKVLGVCLVFDWPKNLVAKDRKIDTKLTFKILSKDGRYFEREAEEHVTSLYRSIGFDNFIPLCELKGDYFLENDQLTVEVEGIIMPLSIIEHTKRIIIRIPSISKMKETHSTMLFKHDLGLQWRIHTEYYGGERPGYNVYLEAIKPKFCWSCDAHSKLSIVKKSQESGLCCNKGLKLSQYCKTLPIGQYNIDEVLDPSNDFVDEFDTLTFQFLLHIYHIQGIHPEYDDGIRGITPIVMNQLLNVDDLKMKNHFSFEIKVPKFTEFRTITYSVLDHAQNLLWVAFVKVEKFKLNNQLDTEALGVYIHCFDPNGSTNWSCVGDIRFTLKASRTENNFDRYATHNFTHKESTCGYNNMLLMKEVMHSEQKYLQNNGICISFRVDCKQRQNIDKAINCIDTLAPVKTRGTIKMTIKDFSKFSNVQVTPDWVDIGSTAFKIMVMTHHKLFHNTVVDKVLAFYVQCDSSRKPTDWRCNTQVALKMKCHLPDTSDLVLNFEHQFSKDVVCFGFEEFLLASLILNPSHGFICNDSIELEAVIEITKEMFESNNNTINESCVDGKSGYLWNAKGFDETLAMEEPSKIDEVEDSVKFLDDWNEDKNTLNKDEITECFKTNDVVEEPEKDFKREKLDEVSIPTLVFKENFRAPRVDCNKEQVMDVTENVTELLIKEEVINENYKDEFSYDGKNQETIQSYQGKGDENQDLEKFNGEINFTVKEKESKDEEQLVTKIINTNGVQHSKFDQADDISKEVVTDLKEGNQVQSVDIIDAQNPVVKGLVVKNEKAPKCEETCQKIEVDLKQKTLETSIENSVQVDGSNNPDEKLHLITIEKQELQNGEQLSSQIDSGVEKMQEVLKKELCSKAEQDEQVIKDCYQNVETVSNVEENSSPSEDHTDMQTPVVEELLLENKHDLKDEVTCTKCKVDLKDKGVTICVENLAQMVNSNPHEDSQLIIPEKGDSKDEKQFVSEIDNMEEKEVVIDSKGEDNLDQSIDNKDVQTTISKGLVLENKHEPKDEVSCKIISAENNEEIGPSREDVIIPEIIISNCEESASEEMGTCCTHVDGVIELASNEFRNLGCSEVN
ncbi:unnamed protein product [Diamesa serratosioi]